MEVDFALLADAANISREGKLNILGSFDRIYGSKFPLTWPRMVLVTRFVASAAEYGAEKTLEIVTLDADGKRLGAATGRMKVPAGQSGRQLKLNHVLPMTMTFPAPGQYSIEILVNGEPKATVPLEVVQREEPKQDGAAEAEPPQADV
ncbi:MAG: hypothetical protein A2148_12590 [Chloroflexi bacterium RBG_16_68_14]|nr:MAG: hypothetical protein A2148_12590 [Chloroflexi bacterium RBG_16_68_14]